MRVFCQYGKKTYTIPSPDPSYIRSFNEGRQSLITFGKKVKILFKIHLVVKRFKIKLFFLPMPDYQQKKKIIIIKTI